MRAQSLGDEPRIGEEPGDAKGGAGGGHQTLDLGEDGPRASLSTSNAICPLGYGREAETFRAHRCRGVLSDARCAAKGRYRNG